MTRNLVVLALLLSTAVMYANQPASTTGSVTEAGAVATFQADPEDVVKPDGLPKIGKWMINPDLTPANWLGALHEGKNLREAINIIIIDHVATSADEAKARLMEACAAAGYPSRSHHSSGYMGYIDGQLYGQLPEGEEHAFSNGPFMVNNNHGRIFGPYVHDGAYLFIGSFSRENVAPFAEVKHAYASFNRARDDFAENMNGKTGFKISEFVHLGNVFVNHPDITTGDHDGTAVLLKAER